MSRHDTQAAPANAPDTTVSTSAPGAAATPAAMPHLLTFDVEEFFQVEAAAHAIGPDNWNQWPSRLQQPLQRILQMLADRNLRATFFILGWVAQRHPHLVRSIARAGHEIASHGMSHTMITRLSPAQFRNEIDTSRKILQDITGQDVIGYRAPTFSVVRRTAWAFRQLLAAGYLYDSSVYTVHHDRYGVPDAPPQPHMALTQTPDAHAADSVIHAAERRPAAILEIPPLTMPIGPLQLPIGGGGYLRLLPVRLMALAINRCQRRGLPAMIYLHPWELDPCQPPIPIGRRQLWRHRIGLANAEKKLAWLLDHYRFAAVADCLPALHRLAANHTFQYHA